MKAESLWLVQVEVVFLLGSFSSSFKFRADKIDFLVGKFEFRVEKIKFRVGKFEFRVEKIEFWVYKVCVLIWEKGVSRNVQLKTRTLQFEAPFSQLETQTSQLKTRTAQLETRDVLLETRYSALSDTRVSVEAQRKWSGKDGRQQRMVMMNTATLPVYFSSR